jgi:hypothetical protein
MTIEFNQNEAAAIQRVVDAALKGSGVNILQECGWLQTKLKAAVDAERENLKTYCAPSPSAVATVKPEINEQS